jgi:sigma-E factor negative regulatory protein RseC
MEQITEQGEVIEKKGGYVIVITQAKEMCGTCRARSFCLLSSDKKIRKIKIKDDIGVSKGDRVEIIIKGSNIVLASFIVYIIPVICLVVSVILNESYFKEIDHILAAAFGLFIGLVIVYIFSRLTSKRYMPRISRIISSPP